MFYSIFMYIGYLLAIYGAITLLLELFEAVFSKAAYKGIKIRMIIVVKNAEEYIEAVIRNAMKSDFHRKMQNGGNLTLVDMDSDDRTLDILKKLQKDYEYIDIFTSKEKEKVFDNFYNCYIL